MVHAAADGQMNYRIAVASGGTRQFGSMGRSRLVPDAIRGIEPDAQRSGRPVSVRSQIEPLFFQIDYQEPRPRAIAP